MCFVGQILQWNMFGAGTTLENQMQQSVSTLTVSRIYKSKEIWPRRNLSRQMTLRSLERKVGNLYLCVLGEKWQAGKNESKKEITVGKSKRSKQGQNLSCRTVSESVENMIFSFFFPQKQLVLLREFFMGSIKSANECNARRRRRAH